MKKKLKTNKTRAIRLSDKTWSEIRAFKNKGESWENVIQKIVIAIKVLKSL